MPTLDFVANLINLGGRIYNVDVLVSSINILFDLMYLLVLCFVLVNVLYYVLLNW